MIGEGSRGPDAPVVTVILLTYNHEQYIAEALLGILAQQTDFGVEIIITEDCSTDGTIDAIEAVRSTNGASWTVLRSPRNECSNRVWRRALDVARGEFIATLDGDDYWTDPNKLARQVEFLRSRPDCSMCFHDVVKLDQTTGRSSRRRTSAPRSSPAATSSSATTCPDAHRSFAAARSPNFRRRSTTRSSATGRCTSRPPLTARSPASAR